MKLKNQGYASVSIMVAKSSEEGADRRQDSIFTYYYVTPSGTVESFSSVEAKNDVPYILYKREY